MTTPLPAGTYAVLKHTIESDEYKNAENVFNLAFEKMRKIPQTLTQDQSIAFQTALLNGKLDDVTIEKKGEYFVHIKATYGTDYYFQKLPVEPYVTNQIGYALLSDGFTKEDAKTLASLVGHNADVVSAEEV